MNKFSVMCCWQVSTVLVLRQLTMPTGAPLDIIAQSVRQHQYCAPVELTRFLVLYSAFKLVFTTLYHVLHFFIFGLDYQVRNLSASVISSPIHF